MLMAREAQFYTDREAKQQIWRRLSSSLTSNDYRQTLIMSQVAVQHSVEFYVSNTKEFVSVWVDILELSSFSLLSFL
jgi:hypothetical protein